MFYLIHCLIEANLNIDNHIYKKNTKLNKILNQQSAVNLSMELTKNISEVSYPAEIKSNTFLNPHTLIVASPTKFWQ